MDGARLSNAAASLNLPLRALTRDAGVDVLSFGGTKNGMMYGEAVLFFRPELAADFRFIRKQGMQLSSKMRFISAQFAALLTDDLWLENASRANRMARLLAAELERLPRIRITQPVEANAVFAIIPKEFVPLVQREYFFYVWNEETSEVRLMASYDTTEDDIRDFVALVERTVR
jgi:threonine aldolase